MKHQKQQQKQKSIQDRYKTLEKIRAEYLDAARMYSSYTIPDLLPYDGVGIAHMPTPYASLPAQACINLASKLTQTLFPPTEAWFTLDASDKSQEDPHYDKDPNDPDKPTKITRNLANMTRAILNRVNRGYSRATISEAMLHLVIVGNCLLFLPNDGDLKLYPLDQYVIRRDGNGDVYDIITKDAIAYSLLPEAIQKAIDTKHKEALNDQAPADSGDYDASLDDDPQFKNYTLYTRAFLQDDQWVVFQEVEGIAINEAPLKFPKDACPYIVLRFNKSARRNYGVSYVSRLFGMLSEDEGLHESLRTSIAAMAKTVYTCKRGGMTNINDISNARNGDIIYGDADNDVSTINSKNKPADLSMVLQELDRTEKQIYQAFTMPLGAIRDSERTTAEEVNQTWKELEQALASAFIVLGVEFQLPYLRRLIAVMKKAGELRPYKDQLVDIKLTTGQTTLGRRDAIQRKTEYLQTVASIFGQQTLAQYIDLSKFLTELANDYQILPGGWIKTKDEIASEQAQAQKQQIAQAMIDKGTGPAINQLGQAYQQQQQMAADTQQPPNGGTGDGMPQEGQTPA